MLNTAKEYLSTPLANSYLRQRNIVIGNLSEMSYGILALTIQQLVSSKNYADIALSIKLLPATKILETVYKRALDISFEVKGGDIPKSDYSEMIGFNLSDRASRLETLVANLMQMHKDCGGIIFLGGCLHASGLRDKFTLEGLQDRVLYYFPHSVERLDKDFDDIKAASTVLDKNRYLLTEEQTIKSLATKINTEALSKIIYQKTIIEGTSTSHNLSRFFNVSFEAILRTGIYVDAHLKHNDENKFSEIIKVLSKNKIHFSIDLSDETSHLTVFNINTSCIARKIYNFTKL